MSDDGRERSYPNFAHVVHRYREERGMTQEQVGLGCDVNKSLVSHWESGIRVPSLAVLGRLVELLHIPANEVMIALRADEDYWEKKQQSDKRYENRKKAEKTA